MAPLWMPKYACILHFLEAQGVDPHKMAMPDRYLYCDELPEPGRSWTATSNREPVGIVECEVIRMKEQPSVELEGVSVRRFGVDLTGVLGSQHHPSSEEWANDPWAKVVVRALLSVGPPSHDGPTPRYVGGGFDA